MAKRGACRQWLAQGSCSWGDRCRFWHPEARSASSDGGRRQSAAEQQQRRQQRQQQQVPRRRWRPEPAYKTRAWCSADGEAAEAAAAPGRSFRVMSYNVLADELAQSHQGELYRRTPPEQLDWARRWGLMAAEIQHHAPDLVCLQEVDHWDSVAADMSQLGFQGAYAQRSGGRADGCATFWRSSLFEGVRVGALRFSEYDMRDNVGLLALLRLKQGAQEQGQAQGQGQSRRQRRRQQQAQQAEQQQQQQQQQEEEVQPMEQEDSQQQQQPPADLAGLLVAVANTHILFNPKRGDLKVGQLRLLIHSLPLLVAQALPAQAAAASQECGVPCLLMGDLNTLPTSPIYSFLRTGALHCLQQHRKDLAGTGDELSTNIARRSRSVPAFGQQQQQWGYYEPSRGAAPWFSGSGPAMPSWQQQQQQYAGVWSPQQPVARMQPPPPLRSQQQHHGGLQHSVSSPVLTLRKLRAAGWSAEELVIATGGVHGSHLRHLLEQLQALRRQQRRQRRQQQQQDELLHQGSDNDDDGAGAQSEQQQQQQQQQDAVSAALHTTLSPPSAATPGVACVQGSIAAGDESDSPALQQQQGQQAPALPFSAWGRSRWDEPLPAALGDGVARHGMRLASCYAEVLGAEPEYTSCHDSFYGTVDYIWYTPTTPAPAASTGGGSGACGGLRPLAVLLPPRADEHLAGSYSLPSAAIPSDHVSLVADFELLG